MAEAPSLRISIRSIADSGIVFRLYDWPCPVFGSALAAGATRRPLSRISVPIEPRPRSDAEVVAREKPDPPSKSCRLPPAMAGTARSNSAAVCTPDFSLSSLVMTWTADEVSASTRLMLEPVTSIFFDLLRRLLGKYRRRK
jgi:hypothetical protein